MTLQNNFKRLTDWWRNGVSLESVRSELCVFFNIPYTCTEFKEAISKNKKLLKAAESSDKYKVNKRLIISKCWWLLCSVVTVLYLVKVFKKTKIESSNLNNS